MTEDIKEIFKKTCKSIGGELGEEEGRLVCRIDTADIILDTQNKKALVVPTFVYEQPIKSASDVTNLMKELLERTKKLKQ